MWNKTMWYEKQNTKKLYEDKTLNKIWTFHLINFFVIIKKSADNYELFIFTNEIF